MYNRIRDGLTDKDRTEFINNVLERGFTYDDSSGCIDFRERGLTYSTIESLPPVLAHVGGMPLMIELETPYYIDIVKNPPEGYETKVEILKELAESITTSC